jgi:hypothetical protein
MVVYTQKGRSIRKEREREREREESVKIIYPTHKKHFSQRKFNKPKKL